MRPLRRVALALGVVAWPPLASLDLHADRRPVVETVDAQVPVPPVAVTVAGRTHVVHELHVTNVLTKDVWLDGVDVLRTDGSRGLVATHRGDDLRARIGRPGLPRRHETPHVIGPGLRAVVHFWFPLPDGERPPAGLRHRLFLRIAPPDGTPLAVETASVPVDRAESLLLGPPLSGGPWAAIYDPVLKGGHRTVAYAVDGRARIPGRFAIDFVQLPASRVFAANPREIPPGWNGEGTDVLAVADAVVAAAADDMPDNPPPSERPRAPMALEDASGNHVVLDLGGGRYAFYEHLQNRSVAVQPRQRVRRGQVVGRLGNSGSSSIGPHLHFHVADADAPLAAEGRPFVFAAFDELGAFASLDALVGGSPWKDAAGGTVTRRHERPAPMAVIRFR